MRPIRCFYGLLAALAVLFAPAPAQATGKPSTAKQVEYHGAAATPLGIKTMDSPVARMSDSDPFEYKDYWFRAQQLAQYWCAQDQPGILKKIVMQKCNAGDGGNWMIKSVVRVDEDYHRFTILRAGAWTVERWGTPQCNVVNHWEQWRAVWIKARFMKINGHLQWRMDDKRKERPFIKLPIPGRPPWVGFHQMKIQPV